MILIASSAPFFETSLSNGVVMLALLAALVRDVAPSLVSIQSARSRLSGFSRKSKAPARVASTASAIVP